MMHHILVFEIGNHKSVLTNLFLRDFQGNLMIYWQVSIDVVQLYVPDLKNKNVDTKSDLQEIQQILKVLHNITF